MSTPGKPYLGIGYSLGLINRGTVHGMLREQFIQHISSRGEPFLFSSTIPVPIGIPAFFFEGTRGSVVRLSTREEFLTWEQRLFPGCRTILVPEDKDFIEVRVD